jgi:hypothetical protein
MACPSPEPPPVTKATFPSNRIGQNAFEFHLYPIQDNYSAGISLMRRSIPCACAEAAVIGADLPSTIFCFSPLFAFYMGILKLTGMIEIMFRSNN